MWKIKKPRHRPPLAEMSLGFPRPDENGMPPVAALFVQNPPQTNRGRPRGVRSPYLDLLPGRCWARSEVVGPVGIIAHADATNYAGPWPVVTHPPCRAWAKLSQWAKPREGERGLATYALACVHRFGGVLEQPEGSRLWEIGCLPRPLAGGGPIHNSAQFSGLDVMGGFSLSIDQVRFGHRCEKATWLYISGCPIHAVMALIPPAGGVATRRIAGKGVSKGGMPQISHYEREHTPVAFAKFLIEIARRCEGVGPMRNAGNIGGTK